MTMRLTIKNEDTIRTARVSAFDAPRCADGTASETIDIGPGQIREFYIHSNRSLTIDELDDSKDSNS